MSRFLPWRELSVAFAVILALAVVNSAQIAWRTLPSVGSVAGWALTGAGLLLSLPPALVYHIRLARTLSARHQLDRGWIWHPTRLHDRLLPEERSYVLRWFRVGAFGWGLTMIGCVWIGLSLCLGGTLL